MSAPAIRVGLVGAGFAARFHWASFRHLRGIDARVTAVHSRTPARAAAFAAERGIRACASFDELVREVAVVLVCAPGYAHEEYCVAAARAGRHVIVEKPFTGYYGPSPLPADWKGNTHPKTEMLAAATASARRMAEAVARAGVKLMYAENWVYAPAVQKEAEIITATKAQLLWLIGEESHSGSHSPAYGVWREAGGGSLVGKGCHPLTAALYLKRVEGLAAGGAAIRPASVTARTHEITRLPGYRDRGHLRTDYHDVEDFGLIHVVFTDGTVADIFSCEIVMGGVHNWIEVFGNNHRNRLNLNPIDACTLYNPEPDQLKDVYIVEKLGTKAGWSHPAPDEDWQQGYPQEIQDFMEAVHHDRAPLCGIDLACDTVTTLYAAYLSAERRGAEVPVELIGG
ncbi:MAG: Gfo/Idh/MocA family oxidoreductase [Planctomycetota bacterium]